MARKNSRTADPPDADEADPNVVVVEDDEPDEDPFGDLAFFSGAEDDVEWGVERYKTGDEQRQNPRGRNRVFVTKIEGKVDLVAFQREFGGGVFRFWGKRGNGTFYGAKKVEIAGPRRSYEAEPPPSVAAVTSSANGLTRGERMIIRAMRDQNLLLAQALAKTTAPPPSSNITELVNALAAMDQLRGRGAPPSDAGLAKEMFTAMSTAFTQGISLGQEREPAPASSEDKGTDWAKIFDNGLAVMERMSRRGGPPRKVAPGANGEVPPQPPPTTSSAEVVDAQVMNAEAARWITAIDRLESLMPAADEAAEEIDVIMTEQDLTSALQYPNAAVIDQIIARVSSGSPLATPDGRAYLDLVLEELRKPASD
jgi:hypothetical protein